jgi:phosphotransferase system  glucose/maltose/N-acetylglucosamine-specific IIC component
LERIADWLNYLLSLVSMGAIVNNVISWVIIVILGAAAVYLWKPLRQFPSFLSSSAETSRLHARADIRMVRSDEYHADRQKLEIHALIIGAASFVGVVSLLPPPDEEGNVSVLLVACFITLLMFVSGGLFYVETRRNEAALKMRMRKEERRRAKRLKVARREGLDVRKAA